MNQTYKDFTLFILDNNSDNSEGDSLVNEFGHLDDIEVHLLPENRGFAKAHNYAFKKLILTQEFKYVALLNNDAEAENDWLENLIKASNTYQADMVSSKMINYFDRTKMDNTGHLFLNTAETIPIGTGENIEKFERVEENMGACAGAALYTSEMLRDIGVFDNKFDTGYEDAEFGLRAIVAGYKSVYEPTAVVYHKMSSSVKKIMGVEYLSYIQNSIFYAYFKLMPLPFLVINAPLLIVKYFLVYLLNLLTGRKQFAQVLKNAFRRTWAERDNIRQERKEFIKNRKVISSISLQRKSTFFLGFDIKRFYNVMFKKDQVYFDQ